MGYLLHQFITIKHMYFYKRIFEYCYKTKRIFESRKPLFVWALIHINRFDTHVYNCTKEYLNLYNIPWGHPMVSDIPIPGKLS